VHARQSTRRYKNEEAPPGCGDGKPLPRGVGGQSLSRCACVRARMTVINSDCGPLDRLTPSLIGKGSRPTSRDSNRRPLPHHGGASRRMNPAGFCSLGRAVGARLRHSGVYAAEAITRLRLKISRRGSHTRTNVL